MRAPKIPLFVTALSCAAWIALAATPPASAQVWQLIDDERGVSSFVIVPPCPPGSVGDNDTAGDTAQFTSTVSSSLPCETAQGMAIASQDSVVEDIFLATGDTYSNAFSTIHLVIHAISSSTYEVSIDVREPAMFALTADLAASGALPVVLSSANTHLQPAQGQMVFAHTIEPLEDGGENTATIAQSGQLAPGLYIFRASSTTVIDASIKPNTGGDGDASFDVELTIMRFADFDDDGSVGPADLAQLLASWGKCPPDDLCLADLTGDGVVGPADLAQLLASWDP